LDGPPSFGHEHQPPLRTCSTWRHMQHVMQLVSCKWWFTIHSWQVA